MLANRVLSLSRVALASPSMLSVPKMFSMRFCGTAVMQKTCYALSTLNSGYQLAMKILGKKVEAPEIIVNINGNHFQKPKNLPLVAYLRETCQKGGYDVEQLELSYFKGELQVNIMSPRDWQSFYENAVDLGGLILYANAPGQATLPQVLKDAPANDIIERLKEKSMNLSSKFRSYWKKLLDVPETNEEKLNELTGNLEKLGLKGFESKAMVVEELGITKEAWEEQVDELGRMGLPKEIGQAMKIAVKNKRGSKKGIYASQWDPQSLSRLTYYVRFQVYPVGDEFDILIALNKNKCYDPVAGNPNSGAHVEQMFKNYIYLDSEIQFKREVRPLLEDE